MKTKAQKSEDLKKGEDLLGKSEAVLLVDFSGTNTKDLGTLRQELKKQENPFFVIKKRLLGILLKKRSIEFDAKSDDMKASMGTVFASNLESAAGSIYRFFKGLEKEKKIEGNKILGGFDLGKKEFMAKERVIAIGQLPVREVLLAQLAAMIAAPVRSLLYIMKERAAQKGSEEGASKDATTTKPVEQKAEKEPKAEPARTEEAEKPKTEEPRPATEAPAPKEEPPSTDDAGEKESGEEKK
jgi:ribosomal protein L10